MKTFAIALFALLALQASASWVLIEGYNDAGCSGDPDSINAYEVGECYATLSGAVKYDDDTYFYYSGASDCEGTATQETEIGDSCEDADSGSGIVVATGLSQPVNADYPYTIGSFSNDDCDFLDMTSLFTTTSADDMADVETGCEDAGGISSKAEFTSTGFKTTIYAETGCSGTSASTEVTFGECEEFFFGYVIMYYSSGSIILASISSLFAIIGFALMG